MSSRCTSSSTSRPTTSSAPSSFAAMKPTALFVNAARGGVVDTAALADALRTGTIALCGRGRARTGASTRRPPAARPRNCTLTPHIAGCTDQGTTRSARSRPIWSSGSSPARSFPPACVVVPPGHARDQADQHGSPPAGPLARGVRRLLARPACRDREGDAGRARLRGQHRGRSGAGRLGRLRRGLVRVAARPPRRRSRPSRSPRESAPTARSSSASR